VSQTHYCVVGDVAVASDAAIAPGVVLQASPGSRIVIASGACLAGGVCIQSRKGVLTIGEGANLGANVLVVGHGEIGPYACISPGSTLMNPQVEAEGLVSPSSLIVAAIATTKTTVRTATWAAAVHANNGTNNGDSNGTNNGSTAKKVTVPQQNDSFVNTFVEPPPIGPKAIEVPSLSDQNGQYVDPSAPLSTQSNDVQSNNGHSNNGNHKNGHSSALSVSGVSSNHRVYGKDQVSQLLSTLFPHR